MFPGLSGGGEEGRREEGRGRREDGGREGGGKRKLKKRKGRTGEEGEEGEEGGWVAEGMEGSCASWYDSMFNMSRTATVCVGGLSIQYSCHGSTHTLERCCTS